jgi:TolB-like protein
MSFWQELKRRNVFRVAVAYLVASWLIAQVIVLLAEPLDLPDSLDTLVIVLLAIGFPIALLVAWAYEVTPHGVRRTADADAGGAASVTTGQRLNVIVTILLALVVGVMAADRYFVGDRAADIVAVNSVETAGATGGPPYRIAVLPLRSVSVDPADQIFADGLTLALISRLASVDGFEMTAGTSSFAFAQRAETASTIGEQLGVDYLLEGDLRANAEMLEVSLRLVTWSTSSFDVVGPFGRSRGEVIALQNDIAAEVADALSVELGVADAAAESGSTDNAEAYDAYLRGSALRSRLLSQEAIVELERAVELDPEFGLAWVALVVAYSELSFNLFNAETAEPIENALQRAFETMPDRWEPHARRAYRLWSVELDWLGAGREFEIATASAGNKTPVDWGMWYGTFLAQVDKATDAVPLLFAARAADPLSAVASAQVAWLLTIAGRESDALREFDRFAELTDGALFPYFAQYLHAALAVDDPERIAMLLDYWSSLASEPAEITVLATAWGSPTDAAAVLRAIAIDAEEPVFIEVYAPIAGYLGDVELALAILQRSYLETGNTWPLWLWHPLLADVRQADGFKELVIELGLPDYWREFGWGDHCRPVGADDFECE